jgi:hypothetical protein
MRSFLGLPTDSRQRDSSVVNTLVDGKSCVSSSRIGSDRCEKLFRFPHCAPMCNPRLYRMVDPQHYVLIRVASIVMAMGTFTAYSRGTANWCNFDVFFC